MTPFVHEYYVNLRTGAAYERAKKPLSQGNALADKIVVHVQDCGNDVDLTGMGVSALVVRFDGQTVPLTGSIEDGAACITLDKDSYAVPGEARVTMMLSAGEMVQTVLVLLVNVDTSQTSIVVDNGTIGDLTELLSAVADMRTATADALAAADTANAAADDNAAKTEAAIVEMRAEADAAIADVHATLDSISEEYTAISARVEQLVEDVGVVRHASKNLANPAALSDGILLSDGTVEESTRKYTDYIPVKSGEVLRTYHLVGVQTPTPFNYTNLCAYNEAKNVLPDAGVDGNNTAATYTVPDGVAYVRMTVAKAYTAKMMITKEVVTEWEPYYEPYEECTKDLLTSETQQQIQQNTEDIAAMTGRPVAICGTAATLSDGESVVLPAPNTSRRTVYSFSADVDASNFGTIVFGRDRAKGYTCYVKIDAEKVYLCLKISTDESASAYAHGLTLDGRISCTISVGDKTSDATLTLSSKSGIWSSTLNFNGNSGDVVLESIGSVLSNVDVRMYSSAWGKAYTLYWDSYETYVGNWMIDQGAVGVCYDAYPGRTAKGGKVSFDVMMGIAKPDCVIWGLGMNNGDSETAINADWLTVAEHVESVCAAKGIELVYLTIPNTPTIRNTYKNAYIKSSGYRYIDVAEAVGASEAGASWYDGLLSTDNIHPTTLGSKVIANTLCASLPEIVGE